LLEARLQAATTIAGAHDSETQAKLAVVLTGSCVRCSSLISVTVLQVSQAASDNARLLHETLAAYAQTVSEMDTLALRVDRNFQQDDAGVVDAPGRVSPDQVFTLPPGFVTPMIEAKPAEKLDQIRQTASRTLARLTTGVDGLEQCIRQLVQAHEEASRAADESAERWPAL
jgi:hypothetical protein